VPTATGAPFKKMTGTRFDRMVFNVCSLYARYSGLDVGRWRAQLAAVHRLDVVRGDGRVRDIKTREGSRYLVDGNSQAGRILIATGDYEPETARIIGASLKPGDTFIDVGAHIGFFTVLAGRRVGPTGRVIAFEPGPATRARLHANVQHNRLGNVTICDEALSNQPGRHSFSVGPSDDSGLATLRGGAIVGPTVDVTCARFDDLIHADVQVAGIKIDVEGAEAFVLAGMERCLRAHRPWIILEVTDAFLQSMGTRAAEMIEWLASLGYAGFAIGPESLVPLPTDLAGLPGQFNALFTQSGKVE
jgi:FkbM family methyltransferase